MGRFEDIGDCNPFLCSFVKLSKAALAFEKQGMETS